MYTKYKYCRFNGIRMRAHRVVLMEYLELEYGAVDKSQMEEYVVHHIDGNGMNNERSNLMFMSRKEHSLLHSKRRMRDSKGRYTTK